MKIGIVSDSHDKRDAVLEAVDLFNQLDVDYVLHAGDMVSPSTAQIFGLLKRAEFCAVFGNCDVDKDQMKSTIEGFGASISDSFSSEVGGKKILMKHNPNELIKDIEAGDYDLIINGHTHKHEIRHVNGTMVVNPGALKELFGDQASVVILDTEDMSCETIRFS